jgi:peptide/nickel transport system substrate-binding protein
MTGHTPIAVTRKDFLKLLGGGALAAGLAKSGLGADEAAAQSTTPIKISFRSALVRLDPAFTVSSDEYVATQSIYDNLTRLDDKLSPIPGIASEWSSPDGGATWLFMLRSGVKFHHGRELDAEDVVFSLSRVLDSKNGSPGRRAVGPIKTVTAEGPMTVKFVLEGPFAEFPAIMSGTFSRIVPRDASENLNQKPVGSGPFKFGEWIPGQHLKLVRNADYWMAGAPKASEVWLVTYPAQAAEQSAFATGETHMMWDVPVALVPAVSKFPNVTLIEVPSTGFQPVVMRSDRPPFNDPRVRRAVKHAISREQVMRFVLQGHGVVAQDTPVAPSSAMYAPVQAPTYDVAEAKGLMKEAGLEAGFPVKLFASNERAGCIETAQVIKPMLEAIGIKAEIQQVPWDRFNAEVWKKETFFISNWVGRPTIDEQLYPYFHTTGSWNEYNYSNPQLDKLLDEARRDLDLASRKAKYAKIQEMLAFDGPAVIPYFANYATARAKSLEGVPVSPLKWVDLREARLV